MEKTPIVLMEANRELRTGWLYFKICQALRFGDNLIMIRFCRPPILSIFTGLSPALLKLIAIHISNSDSKRGGIDD